MLKYKEQTEGSWRGGGEGDKEEEKEEEEETMTGEEKINVF